MAMEQQIKYGIPASVTLAQMAHETGYGRSSLAQRGGNMFGIKSFAWDGMTTGSYRSYDSVSESIEDHSKFLMGNRYVRSRMNLGISSPLDHQGWMKSICNAGYATDPSYYNKIESIIHEGGLEYFDQKAMDMAQQYGIRIGQGQGLSVNQRARVLDYVPGRFCMPIDFENLGISSSFAEDRGSYNHKGIDITTHKQYLPVYSTEDGGRVVAVKPNNGAAGNMVTVEYYRNGHPAYQCTYMHLSQINVREGQVVNAQEQLGVSGSTGHSTGPHLHYQVKRMSDGQVIDPAVYLGELAVRMNRPDIALRKGSKNILAPYENAVVMNIPQEADVNNQGIDDRTKLLASLGFSNDPKKMMEALMGGGSSDGQSQGMFGGLISDLFMAVITLGSQLDAKRMLGDESDEERKQHEHDDETAQETKIKDNERYIHMDRKAVDGKELAAVNSAIFEELSPRQSQGQSVELK